MRKVSKMLMEAISRFMDPDKFGGKYVVVSEAGDYMEFSSIDEARKAALEGAGIKILVAVPTKEEAEGDEGFKRFVELHRSNA